MGTDACLECQRPLTLYGRLRHGHFCSAAHEKDYLDEIDVCGIVRLAEARVRMGVESSTERFTAKTVPAVAVAMDRHGSADRRKHARIALDEPVRVSLVDAGEAVLRGRFVNVSADGLKITLSQSLNVGATVKVECGNHAIVGEVRRSQESVAGYAIGIAISSWLENSDAGEHLTTSTGFNTHSGLAVAATD